MTAICNICQSTEFKSFGRNQRPRAQCATCGSLERHRALFHVLKNSDLLTDCVGKGRCLQFAPEKITHDYLVEAFGTGHVCADLFPERYKHAKCLKIRLPDGLSMFPDNYFDLIVHSHVLEHVPGSYKEHIDAFHRVLKPQATMAFMIPDDPISKGVKFTEEGGEHLPTNADRLAAYGQEDHLKIFGADLLDYLKERFSGFDPILLEDSALKRQLKKNNYAYGVVFWCTK